MKNISITVENKRATVVGSPVIVCGNSDYTVTFAFDDEWSLTGPKTARFVYVKRGKVEHEDKVFEGNTVAVPVLSDVAFVNVGVFAGDLCTTTPAQVRCRASILCGSGTVHEPTPDVYSQIMALFTEMAEKGAFGATEAQAQQIEQNRQSIEQQGQEIAQQGQSIAQHDQEIEQQGQSIEQHGQNIEQHGQDIEDVTGRVAKLEDGTTPAGDSNRLGGHNANEFFPKTGGTIEGDLLLKSSEAKQVEHRLRNTVRNICLTVRSNGSATLYDTTNNKSILDSTADGTNTFNGTASENLPLTGGTLTGVTYFNKGGDCVGYGRIHQDHNSTTNHGLSIRDYRADGKYSEIRIKAQDDKAFFRNLDGYSKEIHHDGNSAKVHVGTSAPSDTSAVWFDTSEL